MFKSVDGSVYLFDVSPRVNEYAYENRKYEPPDYYGDPMIYDHFMNRADFNLLKQPNGSYMSRSPYLLSKHDSSYVDGFDPYGNAITNENPHCMGAISYIRNNPTEEVLYSPNTTSPSDGYSLEQAQDDFETAKQGIELVVGLGTAIKGAYNDLTGDEKENVESELMQSRNIGLQTSKYWFNGWIPNVLNVPYVMNLPIMSIRNNPTEEQADIESSKLNVAELTIPQLEHSAKIFLKRAGATLQPQLQVEQDRLAKKVSGDAYRKVRNSRYYWTVIRELNYRKSLIDSQTGNGANGSNGGQGLKISPIIIGIASGLLSALV